MRSIISGRDAGGGVVVVSGSARAATIEVRCRSVSGARYDPARWRNVGRTTARGLFAARRASRKHVCHDAPAGANHPAGGSRQ